MAALGRCGAGEGSEPENRSVLLFSAAYFYVYVYYNLVDALRFDVLIRCVLLAPSGALIAIPTY